MEGEYNCKLESSECGAQSKSPDATSAATVATAVAEMAMTGIVPVGLGICARPPTLRIMLTGRVAKSFDHSQMTQSNNDSTTAMQLTSKLAICHVSFRQIIRDARVFDVQ